ncbi:MAG: hypothetical protein ACKO0Z_08635, partial [Betaproteobacteria bacterium]
RRLAAGKRQPGENCRGDDCALCVLFYDIDCSGCPVSIETRDTFCEGSPYYAALEAANAQGIDSAQFKQAAKKELKFLESLLPKKKKGR